MKVFTTLLFVANIFVSMAQTSFYVMPNNTNSNYDMNQDSSLVSYGNNPNGKLVLYMGGTNSSTNNYVALRTKIVNLNYKFINLSYPNTVPAASLSSSNNALAFDEYRQEICYGTPLSDAVSVDSLNSIYTRFLHLLNYLNINYPNLNWNDYLISNTEINWNNIIVAGHSQGSGHAAYLAKFNSVERVLMFSGLNDYSDFYSASGNWVNGSSITPQYKFYVYLSLLDEIVDYEKQYTNAITVGVTGDSTHVDNLISPYNNSHNLYTTQGPGLTLLNHSSPIKFSLKNNDVWTYMLTSNSTNQIDQTNLLTLSIYPNPTNEIIKLIYSETLINSSYSIYSIEGKEVKHGILQDNTIQIKNMRSGMYLLSINNQLTKKFIVK